MPIFIVCPNTGKYVSTGVEIDSNFLVLPQGGVTALCPYCHGLHRWTARDAVWSEPSALSELGARPKERNLL